MTATNPTPMDESSQRLLLQNEEIQAFYHTLCHELITPLTSAREFLSIVLDGLCGEISEPQRQALEISLGSCDRLARHVDGLVDMTRLSSGSLTLNREKIGVEDLVRTALSRVAIDEHRLDVHVTSPNGVLPPVIADHERILEVITHVVGNSIKFTPPGGHVTIRAAFDPETVAVRISIQDDGCGMKPADVERAFERLFQVRTCENDGGLGIGLTASRAIVEGHGGRIWIDSEIGRGTTVHFTLPTEHNNEERTPSCQQCSSSKTIDVSARPSPLGLSPSATRS